MNSQIINGCAGTNPGLLTAGTDPGRRYSKNECPVGDLKAGVFTTTSPVLFQI